MKHNEEIVYTVIGAAPHRTLSSRVRLQKVVYLLDQLGFGSGLEFQYYHYGPYSRDLDVALVDAQEADLIVEHIKQRLSDGATYSLFTANEAEVKFDFGGINAETCSALISKFSGTNVIVLELAATVHWLWKQEGVENWRVEIARRKGVKTEGGRLEKALEVLKELGLQPA